MDTGDSKDYVMPSDRDFTVGWALRTLDADLEAIHDRDGPMRVRLETKPGAVEEQTTEETEIVIETETDEEKDVNGNTLAQQDSGDGSDDTQSDGGIRMQLPMKVVWATTSAFATLAYL